MSERAVSPEPLAAPAAPSESTAAPTEPDPAPQAPAAGAASGVLPAEEAASPAASIPVDEPDPAAAGLVEEPPVPPAAPPRVLPPAATAALLRALAEAGQGSAGGEDDLDPFPMPPMVRAAELRRVAAAARPPAPPRTMIAPAPPKPEAADSSDLAIARFHQEIGLSAAPASTALVPAADSAPALPEAVPFDGGAGGGGAGGGDGPDGGAGASGGGRRRSIWEIEDRPMTIFEHLDELRTRLVWAALAFVLGTAVTFPFVGRVLQYTMNDAARFNVGGVPIKIIGGAPMATLFASIKLACVGGLFVGGPVILFEAVAFVLPALTGRERGVLFSYLPGAMLLFAVGVSFGLFVFQPVALKVATTFLAFVQPTYTLNDWVNFVLTYSLYFGLLYQLPVVVAIAVRIGLLTPQALAQGRRWALMSAVVIALMFAPPADFIFTPTLIAGPLYGLYEVSILVGRLVYRTRLREEAA